MKKTLLVNLFGGPGTGKSTMMASIFAELKWQNIMAEMVPEIAKKHVWKEDFHKLENQMQLFEETLSDTQALIGKVDVIVTDSPLLNNIIYIKRDTQSYYNLRKRVVKEINMLENITLNIFLRRKKIFRQEGRLQNEEEAIAIDTDLKNHLHVLGLSYFCFDGTREDVEKIVNFIKNSIEL